MKNVRIKDGFGLVSNTVIRDPNISLREKAIYAYLCTYADGKTNHLTVSVYRIAEECGISVSTVKRCLMNLKKCGIIGRTARGVDKTTLTILIK